LKKLILLRNKEKSLQRFHPWVYSGAVYKKDPTLKDGDNVEVYDSQNQYLATGHYHNNSICVRIFSFIQIEPDYTFWKSKFENAIQYRKSLQLIDNKTTTIFRLINGEGDFMPGLIIDWFNGNVVIQFHSVGMYFLKDTIIQILLELFPNQITSIYNKSAATLYENLETSTDDGLLYGTLDEVLVHENSIPFYVDIVNGQKTGFFIDQRDNRQLVGDFSKGRRVLNLFCYTGGFSLYAIEGGAQLVHSVDISKKAIEWTEKNVGLLNGKNLHQSYAENVFDFLDDIEDGFYDLIVLDPPAFAKHHRAKDQGIKGYRNINRKAMVKLKPGGLLFTFSCSQAITQEDFQTIVFSAAAIENKTVRIVKQLHQSLDHPVSIYHPEGEYLKGLMLQIGS
jgi:23S rRNA (cytosine1962-C5)-methyltransferase